MDLKFSNIFGSFLIEGSSPVSDSVSTDAIQLEIIDTSSSSGDKSVEKCTTDDDSAVVMDEDAGCADCSSNSNVTSNDGGSTSVMTFDLASGTVVIRGTTSIMRSVSDALECACVQNNEARRGQGNQAVSRRGSLKHNMDHPFNSYLRKPEVLETVYSVDEETDDVLLDTQLSKVCKRQNSAGKEGSATLPVNLSNSGVRIKHSDISLMRSESCEFNLSGKKTPRTGSALMSRLRAKKYVKISKIMIFSFVRRQVLIVLSIFAISFQNPILTLNCILKGPQVIKL